MPELMINTQGKVHRNQSKKKKRNKKQNYLETKSVTIINFRNKILYVKGVK